MKSWSRKHGLVGSTNGTNVRRRLALFLAATLASGTCFIAGAQEPQRIPGQVASQMGSVAGTIRDQDGLAVVGARVELKPAQGKSVLLAQTDGEGIYRLNNILAGDYQMTITAAGYNAASAALKILPGKLQALDLQLQSTIPASERSPGPAGIPGGARTAPVPATDEGGYPTLPVRIIQPTPVATGSVEVIPNEADNFATEPYRWTVDMPEWQRYTKGGDFPYVTSNAFDPFNRNKIKGDYPIFGQRWFLDFTGTSLTQTDTRRLPTPSGISSEEPGSSQFFGRSEQFFLDQSFIFSFDLFRGDTSFQPVDFRVRVTPVVDLNFLQTQERGIVNIDVAKGTNRFDTHTGLQEAFFEAKIHDLSPNFDFISVRAGIQGFSSDFRGLIFVDQDPAIRVFGNLDSNRINYNLAYFYLLEKDTNSGLNTFNSRHQQVGIANVYIQDFLAKGYTTQFSFLYNYDHGGILYDKNGFLVRPAPIGSVVQLNGIPVSHDIRSYYLGWTGNGHIGPVNVSNAFYQVLGTDSFNSIAGSPLHINAQLGALEVSKDRDWLRFRGSILWASGDGNSYVGTSRKSETARGFDSILDDMQFAGGQFSFWDREGIRLTGTGVDLVTPFSLLPDLRSSKIQGQSNFVNPGVRVFNAGIDADLTPKLRAFLNVNYLQFDRTETLQYLLFQEPVNRNIGTDTGIGVIYRPPLTDNIVITAGVSDLVPALGLRNIYQSKVLISGFVNVSFQF